MNVSWDKLFVPENPLLELFLRGSVMYLALFVILRILVKRHISTLGVTDLLMIVLIADAAQNGMVGQAHSITESLVVCGTIIFWSHVLDWLAFRYAFIRRWVEPAPVALIKHGRVQRRHLRQEMISEEELLSQLRQQGIEDVKAVKMAYVEPDGQISVIRWEPAEGTEGKTPAQRKKQAAL